MNASERAGKALAELRGMEVGAFHPGWCHVERAPLCAHLNTIEAALLPEPPAKVKSAVWEPPVPKHNEWAGRAGGVFWAHAYRCGCAVRLRILRMPKVWRGAGATWFAELGAPPIVSSFARPELLLAKVYLPGGDADSNGAPLSHIFRTEAEADAFINDKLAPTMLALSELADKTIEHIED